MIWRPCWASRPSTSACCSREVTGQRPVEYINSHRIKLAKDLLVKEPALMVSEVGKRVGFDNNSYFSTIFRKYEGISPRQYKELH
jgi:AraC family transcriptional regulator of arabinose operon